MTYVTFCTMFTGILPQFTKKRLPALAAGPGVDYNGRSRFMELKGEDRYETGLLAHYLANSEEAKELQYQIENLVEKQILTGN